MKSSLLPLAIGLLSTFALLIAGFFFGVQPGQGWLSHLAFGFGDYAFPYARHAGLIGIGESQHHWFVLCFSGILWMCVFTGIAYLCRKRA
ncbi:hypothetical protein ACFPPA_18955 [Rhodanobacter ginsengisoli]|uniref:Uncharacterized protein n=1 Tax=Rhodanobacter ginsengisoli TaxID=418646 RepID=A0ABW0QTG6_9GAMM